MTAETRTEYAIKGTALRRGKRVVVVEELPGVTDLERIAQVIEEKREWQAGAGITPDAELVSRTVTVTDWEAARWPPPSGPGENLSGLRSTPKTPALRRRPQMTRQTDRPLEHRSLNATNREAVALANLVREGDLLLNTPYQRGDVWTLDQRVALVKSWMLGLPIPAMILSDRMIWWDRDVDGVPGPAYAMIDGKQRTLTAIAWYDSDFAVPASWFPADQIAATEDTDDGPYVRFSGLTVVGQRRFQRMAHFPVCEARVSDVNEEAEIYLLVNGAGTPQTDEDMNRAQRIAHPDA